MVTEPSLSRGEEAGMRRHVLAAVFPHEGTLARTLPPHKLSDVKGPVGSCERATAVPASSPGRSYQQSRSVMRAHIMLASADSSCTNCIAEARKKEACADMLFGAHSHHQKVSRRIGRTSLLPWGDEHMAGITGDKRVVEQVACHDGSLAITRACRDTHIRLSSNSPSYTPAADCNRPCPCNTPSLNKPCAGGHATQMRQRR